MPDHADGLAAEAAEAADDGRVLAELAVAGERNEIGDQAGDVVEAMRPLRMARHLRFLPGRELGIEFLERGRCLRLEPADLVADGDRVVALAHGAQFLDLGLQFGHRFFEVEIAAHGNPAAVISGRGVTRAKPLSQAIGLSGILRRF